MFNFLKYKSNSQIEDISQLNMTNKKIAHIYIIGNGASLNNFRPEQFKNKFTIGTNRSWLWGNTDILLWRDHRISEEIDFFKLEKHRKSLWICSKNKSFYKDRLTNYKHITKFIDYTFNDTWIKKKLKINIKWNGIVFHAITLAKHISPNATIHLLGIDLEIDKLNNHHFFTNISGFNQGYYKQSWDSNNFNFKKRLDMMYKNFELMKNNGFNFKNYSEKSRLRNLFGLEKKL